MILKAGRYLCREHIFKLARNEKLWDFALSAEEQEQEKHIIA